MKKPANNVKYIFVMSLIPFIAALRERRQSTKLIVFFSFKIKNWYIMLLGGKVEILLTMLILISSLNELRQYLQYFSTVSQISSKSTLMK